MKSVEARRQEIDELLSSLVGSARPGSTSGTRSRPGSVVSVGESGLSEATSPTQAWVSTSTI